VSLWLVALGLAAAYVAVHLFFLPPSLEDIDSINFALGLRDFDPAQHQPHPPGYPVYVALGRGVLAIVSGIWSEASPVAAEALALSLISAISAGIALLAASRLFAAIGGPRLGVWATVLLAAAPLFWLTSVRPMSDMFGLALALTGQALTAKGFDDRRWLTHAAIVSGVAAGVRIQTLALTLPVLAVGLFRHRGAGWRWLARPVAALPLAGLAWAIPLLAASGGVAGYLRALGSQAGEDFAWVNMLWLEPTPRRLAFSLYETLVLPWASVPLAAVVLAAAVLGFAVMVMRERRPLWLLLAAFGPYTALHLLLQETITVRYALPVLPMVAFLCIRGMAVAGRALPLVAVPLVGTALIVAVPATVAFGREMHPAFRAIGDAVRRATTMPPAAVYTHYSLRRPIQADGSLPFVEPRRQYEWLGPVEYWKGGGTAPIWFLADPRRTDVALIDPRSRLDVVRYRWSLEGRPELGGSRPMGADWYRLEMPGWFAGQGWGLTPETGGLARADATGPDRRPIDAWVRRRTDPAHLVVGGWHLGQPGDPAAAFELAIDGEVRDRWTVTAEEGGFLRFLDLPDGIGGRDGYAHLTIAARSQAEGDAPAVTVQQFDVQTAQEFIFGFGEGWYQEEFDPPSALRWRWTSDRAVIRVKGPTRPVQITLRGESPLRYVDVPPKVRITAAGRTIGEFAPTDDFEWTVTVPAEDVTRAGGAITVETDRVYLPGPAEGTDDARRLGLRIFECRVSTALP
jgi:hypothetical protein